MTKEEAAYCAGIIDGEGWIGAVDPGKGHGRLRPKVEVESCDRDLIEWLHEKAGGFTVVRPKRSSKHKPAWGWRISGKGAREFLEEIEPYLVMQRRKDKITEVLNRTAHLGQPYGETRNRS